MAYIVYTEAGGEPRQPIRAEACRTALVNLRAIVAVRPGYQPPTSKPLVLKQPACEHQCPTCYMACAIAPERVAWWETELARAEAFETGAALGYGGAIFLEPAGRA